MTSKLLTLFNRIPIKVVKIVIGVFAILILSTLVFSPYIPFSVRFKAGDIATRTVHSPRYIKFQTSLDLKKSEELRRQRAAQIPKIYTANQEINKKIRQHIEDIFNDIAYYKNEKKIKKDVVPSSRIKFLGKTKLTYLSRQSFKTISSIKYFLDENTEVFLQNGIEKVVASDIKQQLTQNLTILNLDRMEEDIMFSILVEVLEPNMQYNESQHNAAIQKVVNSVVPLFTEYKEGEPIVYKGEMVEPGHIEALKALNVYELKTNFLKFASILLITFFLFLLFERFIYYFNFKIYKNIKYFLLAFIIILLVLVMTRILQTLNFLPLVFDNEFLIPIAIASMTLSILVTPNLSLLTGTLISVLVCIMYKADFHIFIFLFFSNCVASFSSYKKNNRSELIYSGYIVGLFNLFFVFAIGLFKDVTDPWWYGANMFLAMVNGVVSSMISLALLPYLEGIFNITTRQRLLELSNLNHPLLKRMMTIAPGTYQHSLMVANLAEAAAEAVHADPVLCRVGAYFHDIGKMKRPLFFTENQFSGENPHTTLSPRMSKIIIASHTKDGVEMGKKHRLPEPLLAMMLEHHGTSLVSFFYTAAKFNEEFKENDESVKEEFRYSGPKPSFKESGIVMLSDSVEAAVRSLEKRTPAKIENLIDKIFQDKIEDNQLDNCPLSLMEIDAIRDTFLNVFNGMYHSRIDYKDELEQMVQQAEQKQNDEN